MYIDLNNRKGQEQEWANAALKLHDLQTAMKNMYTLRGRGGGGGGAINTCRLHHSGSVCETIVVPAFDNVRTSEYI